MTWYETMQACDMLISGKITVLMGCFSILKVRRSGRIDQEDEKQLHDERNVVWCVS